MIQLDPAPLRLVQTILRAHLPENAVVSVFGSRAKNRARPASDLDLAIDLGRKISLHEHALLRDAFEEAPLAFRVDLIDLQTVSPDFKHRIEPDLIRFPPFETDVSTPAHATPGSAG